MTCGKCKKDDCGGQCAMDRHFLADYKDRLIYSSTGFRGTSINENLEEIEQLELHVH